MIRTSFSELVNTHLGDDATNKNGFLRLGVTEFIESMITRKLITVTSSGGEHTYRINEKDMKELSEEWAYAKDPYSQPSYKRSNTGKEYNKVELMEQVVPSNSPHYGSRQYDALNVADNFLRVRSYGYYSIYENNKIRLSNVELDAIKFDLKAFENCRTLPDKTELYSPIQSFNRNLPLNTSINSVSPHDLDSHKIVRDPPAEDLNGDTLKEVAPTNMKERVRRNWDTHKEVIPSTPTSMRSSQTGSSDTYKETSRSSSPQYFTPSPDATPIPPSRQRYDNRDSRQQIPKAESPSLESIKYRLPSKKLKHRLQRLFGVVPIINKNTNDASRKFLGAVKEGYQIKGDYVPDLDTLKKAKVILGDINRKTTSSRREINWRPGAETGENDILLQARFQAYSLGIYSFKGYQFKGKCRPEQTGELFTNFLNLAVKAFGKTLPWHSNRPPFWHGAMEPKDAREGARFSERDNVIHIDPISQKAYLVTPPLTLDNGEMVQKGHGEVSIISSSKRATYGLEHLELGQLPKPITLAHSQANTSGQIPTKGRGSR